MRARLGSPADIDRRGRQEVGKVRPHQLPGDERLTEVEMDQVVQVAHVLCVSSQAIGLLDVRHHAR